MGSVDGVKMFVESTVTSDHVKDGSVARFVLNVVDVKLTNDEELMRSNDFTVCVVSSHLSIVGTQFNLRYFSSTTPKKTDFYSWHWASIHRYNGLMSTKM